MTEKPILDKILGKTLDKSVYGKMSQKEKIKYLEEQLGGAVQMLAEGAMILEEYSTRYSHLYDAVKGLLAFIKEKYPDDFKEGGKGFTCPHHKKLAWHMEKWKEK